MKNSDTANSQGSSKSATPQDMGFSPWQRLKSKRISYLTLPLLIMATVTEFVILATGWKYQQVVCLPSGMGVTFFGIGPIGATILAVELLKLPLAIWTASRQGLAKGLMLIVGLPLICLLTFQLVKDMAVYEMGVALTPASQMLKEASKEEVKIIQLNGELANIGDKKSDRDRKLSELAARKAKAKGDLEESLKRNEEARQDAISLTDYQKKELADVQSREAAMIKQFDADTEQLNKALTDLRARHETEVGRATTWNAEEARLDNIYKAKLADYTNRKDAYDKEEADYENANALRRSFMKKPIDPGVPPARDSNTILKPATLAEIDDQIKAKEAELLTVNNQRRDRVAQVENDAHRLREEFDTRSSTKREESDHKREELLASQAAMATQWTAEEKGINQEYEDSAHKADGIRAQLEDAQKKAESFYEMRETAIQNTQVHRIATTVEILRGLIKGRPPVSIKLTAKERGDLYTDQISMVRIWVYPVLAFIVAFLPTLMVEIGFSTVFQPEEQRRPYRMGFLGRRLHWLYMRAGRLKILRAERIASEASGEIAARDRALAEAKAAADTALVEKETELQATREALSVAAARHNEQLKKIEKEQEEQAKIKNDEWMAKFAGMADSLNRTVVEKDALRDLQKSEIERQIAMRQNAWSDRLTQMRQELDDQRTAAETERTAMMQAHHQKLMDVTEDCKTQVFQARRQAADAELGTVEASAKLNHDLKEALHARDTAEAQLKQQSDSFSIQLSQTREDGARELEKVTRQEKHRFDRQQMEFAKTIRQREEDFEHQLQQCQQELSLGFDARLVEKEAKLEQDARRREAELTRQFEARALEVDARWKQEVQQREETAQARLKQREQQLQAQAEARLNEVQTQAEQELRRRESELLRQLEAQVREADARLKLELQPRELAYQAKLKQREQELALKSEAREIELQKKWAADLRVREEEWEVQAQARVRATETRLALEVQQKDEAAQARAKQREQELVAQITAQLEARQKAAQSQWETETEKKTRNAVEPFKALLVRTEKERDEALHIASESARQVQSLEKKLTEASTFLNGWRNGKNLVGADR
ncbi:MAG TPA: hypothetical protein VGR14_03075 [Verrucomicrobiae bacterium]|jgi:hypothetical protein|nr:hypothetical protein [Verrucomicrobiae bacterium]